MFIILATLILIVLKLVGAIGLSWWWVFLGPFALYCIVLTAVLFWIPKGKRQAAWDYLTNDREPKV